MQSVQSKLEVGAMMSRFGVLKEPRGLIRILQFIFAIFAFATACNGHSTVQGVYMLSNQPIIARWSYPYNLKNTMIETFVNNTRIQKNLSDSSDTKSRAEFFVFVGVTSMLLTLVALVIYVPFDNRYRNDDRFPLIDFIITIIWTIFWLVGSAAWAQGVSKIQSNTKWSYVTQRLGICNETTQCLPTNSGNYASIIVSVLFGFLNFLLWLGSIWFIYKETRIFKNRHQQPNSFSNAGAPGMQEQPSGVSPGTY